jgi:hypothetical protein
VPTQKIDKFWLSFLVFWIVVIVSLFCVYRFAADLAVKVEVVLIALVTAGLVEWLCWRQTEDASGGGEVLKTMRRDAQASDEKSQAAAGGRP